MKALLINQSDISGGAAIAGYRLHRGLIAHGVHSRLMVGFKKTQDEQVDCIPRKYRAEKYIRSIATPWGLNYVHHIGSFWIPQHPSFQAADVLNFHNLHSGTFNYLALPQLTRNKPAVLTLHDMWTFTGHCSYSYDCQKWMTGCGQCPYPETYPAIKRDNTRLEWRLKSWLYDHSNLTVVTPSRWLTEQAQKSILNRFPIHRIPYGLDTQTFCPLNPRHCRDKLGIPQGKKVLMFAAATLAESRKGGDLLIKALQLLPEALKPELVLLTIGKPDKSSLSKLNIDSLHLGYLSAEHDKAVAYSAADLFVFPTRADNLPLVLQESMACGTPAVSFKIGGVPDLVRPGLTGYLATPGDPEDLSNGIVQLLENTATRLKMRETCRAIAVKEYAIDIQVKRYLEIFNQLLAK
ncbi:MAG: glycosyltransferase family 4 protein [Cyanobacteria bacterium P01_G01_bin.38]